MEYFPEYNWMVSVPMLVVPPTLYAGAAVAASRRWPSGLNLSIKNMMRVYNVVQIVVCLYMTIGLSPVVSFPNVFGIASKFTPSGEWFLLVHYLSKYLDWFDTFFIIAKGNAAKQLSFLHVYHHATIGALWGALLRLGNGNGTARYGAFINSVTHVIMYSHYLWTSFGFTNPFKALVTKWQIFQFYTCFLHAVLVVSGVWLTETEIALPLAWLQFGYHITMIYLFTWKLKWVPNVYLSLPAAHSAKKSR